MYYLQSRYYDPFIGRFINADVFPTTDPDGFLSCNMFAYCENNPVNRSDIEGKFPTIIISMFVGGCINFATTAYASYLTGQEFSVTDAFFSFGIGALNYSGWGETARMISSLTAGIYTLISVGTDGGTWYNSLACASAAFFANYCSFSTLSGFDSKTFFGALGMAGFDLTFGFGESTVVNGLCSGVNSNSNSYSTSRYPYIDNNLYRKLTFKEKRLSKL